MSKKLSVGSEHFLTTLAIIGAAVFILPPVFFIIALVTSSDNTLATFDMGKSIMTIKYVGDCGAGCGVGDIVVYQQNYGFLGKIISKKTLFTLPETFPDHYKFIKLDEQNIAIYKKSSNNEEYCTTDPIADSCVEEKYIIKEK